MMTTTNSKQTEMKAHPVEGEATGDMPTWRQVVLRYQQPSRWRAIWQLVNTLVPYAALWVLMYFLVASASWLLVPAAILLGGLTVREYLAASRRKRLAYRLMRNPGVLFVLGPLYMLVIKHRLTHAEAGRRERLSVHWTNLSILGMAAGLSLIFGLKTYLLIQLAALAVAGSVGIWLFYVQHQFEGVYWQRHDEWDYLTAALQGASFYKLPKILQWFSGNIGYHHIHHLSPAIPNYNLERCHNAEPLFQTVPPITLFGSLQSLAFRLWDEKHHCLVGFDHLKELRQGNTP